MPIITLGEGDTPLVKSQNIAKDLGCELYFKLEGCNPTGSFKDRGMVLAVSKALVDGAKYAICASTGNTSAAVAAYAARFGLKAFVVIPDGKIAMGKLAQAIVYGATVVKIRGNFDQALELVTRFVAEQGERHKIVVLNSTNPYRLQGQKTAALEIIERLGDAPAIHCIPVGNAGNISAYWMGYAEAHERQMATRKPRMFGFQAVNAAPIVNNRVVKEPQTVATAIRIGNPVNWEKATTALEQSDGLIAANSDDEILAAQSRLAREEGIFCEPASAISLAGLLALAAGGMDFAGATIVCTLTGNGLKDVAVAQEYAAARARTVGVDADIDLERLGVMLKIGED